MISAAILLQLNDHGQPIDLNKPFSTFPMTIGPWVGTEDHFEKKIYNVLGVDDSFLGNYQTIDGRYLQLYIGYYQSQREGNIIHSPKNCMPGAGWNITKTTTEELEIPDIKERKIKVIKLVLEKGPQKQLALYWFQSRGRFIASEYMQKIYLVLDSIRLNRTDGSFVRLIAPVVNGDESKAFKDLKDFATQIIPILQEYLPS
jgi:EpsI family protein